MKDHRRRIILILPACWLILAACSTQHAGRTVLDMTYPLDEAAIFWPTAKPFSLAKVGWSVAENGRWYASNEFSASEHGGTHADAPIHFAAGGRTLDQIPLEEWIGPAVKVDVTAKCAQDRDYLLTVEDLKAWEKENGRIPDGAWVIMYTGIGTRHYPARKMVLGTEKTGAEAIPELSFPGFSAESIDFLLKGRALRGIAIDTPSIDYGKSSDFIAHQVLCRGDRLALENIANLDRLPTKGATLYVIPMLIREGTGAPVRVYATWD